MTTMQIGWIGMGRMGFPMAERLVKAGYSVKVWNRTRSKAEPLQDSGAILVDTPSDLAGVDVLATMVSTTIVMASPMTMIRMSKIQLFGSKTWMLMATAPPIIHRNNVSSPSDLPTMIWTATIRNSAFLQTKTRSVMELTTTAMEILLSLIHI